MAEMTLATGATHLGPSHPVTMIDAFLDGPFAHRGGKARPAAAAIILVAAFEQGRSAAGTAEFTIFLHIEKLAREGPFGGRFPKDPVLFRGKLAPPFRVFELHFVHLVPPAGECRGRPYWPINPVL